MDVPVKRELLQGLLVCLLIIGVLYIGLLHYLSTTTTPLIAILPRKRPDMLKPIEMRRIMYDDVKEANDGVVTASDERYRELIYSRMTEPDTTRPRTLNPPYDKTQDFGQKKQPYLVNKRLKDRRNGFFVECGAYDGQSISNSLFLEMERGWTGLLIEPQPDLYSAVLRKNRQVYTLNACISHTRRPHQVSFLPLGAVGGIKLDDETAQKATLPVQLVKQRFRPIDERRQTLLQTIPIMCFPLNDILTAINVTHVDYLSLDIGGLEAEVLEILNWKKIRIDIMTVEFKSIHKLERLRELMKQIGGYREVGLIDVDVVFEREDLNIE